MQTRERQNEGSTADTCERKLAQRLMQETMDLSENAHNKNTFQFIVLEFSEVNTKVEEGIRKSSRLDPRS
jgi:hypothetical protein